MLYNFIFIAVSTHSHIPCHCEEHSKWALYNTSLHICFFLYKNMISWFKILTAYHEVLQILRMKRHNLK